MADPIILEIRRPDKDPSVFPIDPGIYRVGSDEDCHVRLSHRDVEGRHAVLTVRPDACWIEDLDAPTGT
ncbi:MAG: FHA domain-containing protein, partial [Planctomycetota bacterium]